MNVRSSFLVVAFALSAFPNIIASAAKAETGIECSILNCPTVYPVRGERLDQAFERVFMNNDREAYKNQAFPRQLSSFVGLPGGFPENEMRRDSQAIHELYVELLEQQANNGAIIRTPDLPNPYNTSLNQVPGFNFNRPVRGTELYYQELPPR